MKITSRVSPWLLAMCVGCLLTSCSTTSSKKTPAKAEDIHLYMQADLISLDPRIGYDRRSLQVSRELFEGLMRIGKEGKPELALARSISLSDDKTVYTFHLRPSQWSNGLDLTADDFVWTFRSILDGSTPTTGSYALFVIKNAKKFLQKECPPEDLGVKAIDPLTLEITLEHPAPYFLEFLTLPIYAPTCRAACEKNPEWASKVFPEFVCNGPYILKDRKLKSHITLEKNPLYLDKELIKTPKIHFAIIEDSQTAYNMFEEGSLDWYGDTFGSMSLEMVHELTTKKELITAASGGGIWLLCQTEVPHLASVKIRKAIACAIDRSMICDSLLQGGEKPAYTIVPPPVSLLDRPSFEYNPTAARQLFEEGMKELGYTRETYPPIELSYFSDPMVKAVVGVEQQQLQQNLGITVKLVPYDWGTFFKKWHSGDFQTLSLGWITWYPDPSYNLEAFKYKDKGLNFTRWGNPEFTELLDLADASCDTQIRNDYLRKAEHLLMQEFPVIPVFFTTFKYTKKPQVCGEALSQVGQLELRWMEKTT